MIEWLHQASLVALALACVLVLVRLWRGPSIFDRVLAVDTLTLAVVGYLLLPVHGTAGRYYTDAALGLALFGFVGTTFIAHLLGEGEMSGEVDGHPEGKTEREGDDA